MTFKRLTALILTVIAAFELSGQENRNGVIIYSLPSTTIHLEVKAICESYTPGPYAGFAKKYLGIDVSEKESTKYTLSDIRITPYMEADRSRSYIINLEGMLRNASQASFLKLSSQGLILLSDENKGGENTWRFPSYAPGSSSLESEATGNLTSEETTLYRTGLNSDGEYERIAYKQSQVVEKSTEKKAQEAASMILYLRQQKINIITGNTDATFSGDALRAAVEEINSTEAKLMSLFTGSTRTSVQTMNFDVVPAKGHEEEMTVAFRISDTHGLLPSDDISGRPIVMEIVPEQEEVDLQTEQITSGSTSGRRRTSYEAAGRDDIVYRIPAICTVRITDGQDLILKCRMPVYQKGQDLTFPLTMMIK